ncbi:efflux transporter outer membrane subunit [soil metagenome]
MSQSLRSPLLRSLVLASVLLSSCTLGPDYLRPSAPMPTAFREAEPGWKPAEPADAAPRGDWWRLFDDPELDALVDELNRNNFTLAAYEGSYRQAAAIARQARAALLPTAGLSASTGRSNNGNVVGPSNSSSVSVNASWELDLWGRLRRNVEANAANAEASAADMAAARLSLQAEIISDWFSLRIADQQIALLEESISAYERSLEVTQNRYNSGIVTRADVAQAQTQVLSTRASLIDAGIQRAQIEHAIAILFGRAPSDFSLPRREFVPNLPAIPPTLPSTLLERRPDIAASERRIQSANAQIGIARAAFFPTLSLSAQGGYSGSSNLFSAANRFWSIGPDAALTLFDGGARSAVSESAEAGYDVTVANYRQTVLNALQEVEDNLVAVRLLERETQVQSDAVRAAQESLTLTTNQYKAGTVSFLNVVTAQTTELANRRQLLDIASRRYTATVTLIRALGGSY